MFEIVFLGTSASAPSARRGLSAQVVKHDEFRFLIDCGEGTQRQILQSGLGFKHLNHILITHGHLDHILGLGGLLSTFMRWETIDELNIYSGRWALDRINDLLYGVVLRGAQPPLKLQMHEISPGVFFEADDFTITAFPVHHRGSDCLGFKFEEKSHRPFLPEKAEELGVPPGPQRRDLVNGKTITLADGRRVRPDDVLGALKSGVRFVHVGDAGRTEDLVEACSQADALVIESTYLESEAEMAKQFSHLTAKQAAELAISAGVRQLILTHISRRYREKDVLVEAQAVFPNVSVARDFDVYQIKQSSYVLEAASPPPRLRRKRLAERMAA
jgi:ribonuclease Z